MESRELSCRAVRAEMSARLDSELDRDRARALEDHISGCDECRAHEAEIERVRRALRAQPIEAVPDLSARIMERVRVEGDAARRRDLWRFRVRVASISAAAAVLVLIGATLPWGEAPPDIAAAAQIARQVRSAARTLDSYRATYRITERGWHRQVPVRRFTARVLFEAPESLRMTITDHTRYPQPGLWPDNDVKLIANAEEWWIREPVTCPTEAMPGCALAPEFVERSVVHRSPFDGSSSLPTDIIVPLETIAGSRGFDVIGKQRVLGRMTYRLALPFHQAVPLVEALQPGGSWRSFEPLDEVHVWIDQKTWFPLRYELRSARTGRLGLEVRALSFSQPRIIPEERFETPPAGIVRDGDFTETGFAEVPQDRAPRYLAGLQPYRAGELGRGGSVLSYKDGMTWLKVTTTRMASFPYRTLAEEIRREDGGVAYYEPAMEIQATESLKRRVDIYGNRFKVHLESNLARADLLEVADSVNVSGRAIPKRFSKGGLVTQRVDPRRLDDIRLAEAPSYLPSGYDPTAAFLSRSRDGRRTLTVYYRRAEAEYDGFGIRLTQSRPVEIIPPSPEEFTSVRVGNTIGRHSALRSELEWIDGRTYRAVAAPSLDSTTLLRIARSLR